MKKIISVILAAVIMLSGAALLTSCGKSETDAPAGMKRASSENAGCDFFVPEPWICDVQSGATTAYYSSTDASNVSVMSFSAEYSDYTADNWWESFKADFEGVYSDFEVISSENTVLDGTAAMKFIYKGVLEERTYQFLQVVAVKNVSLSAPQVFVFTYTSLPDTFDSHMDDVSKMLDNFKFN